MDEVRVEPPTGDRWGHVAVPSVVGLAVWRAWILLREVGLDLAGPNQDGWPVHELTLGPSVRVSSQQPGAGRLVPKWTTVAVTWDHEDLSGVREPRTPLPRTLRDAAAAADPPRPSVLRIDQPEPPPRGHLEPNQD